MRLIEAEGGDGQWHNIQMMNDTGSDIMKIFDSDFAMLGNLSDYDPVSDWVLISDANGFQQPRQRIFVEVQLARGIDDEWGPSFLEAGVIYPDGLGIPRLTGLGLRLNFFIGTAPDFTYLAVACTKSGMSSLL
jgi:hypothetical protein